METETIILQGGKYDGKVIVITAGMKWFRIPQFGGGEVRYERTNETNESGCIIFK